MSAAAHRSSRAAPGAPMAAVAEKGVHPTAVVHPSATLDPTVQLGPYAVIGEDVVLGAGTVVGAHAVVEFATLGKNNRLFPGCYVGGAPQDLKYAGERTQVLIGDRNTIRELCQINRGTKASGRTVVGSDNLLCAYTHVAHDCVIGSRVVLVSFAALAGHVEIQDFCVLSAHVGVHQFVRIGRMAMIAAGAGVGKDVPPFCTAQGERATLRGLNVVGLRRSGMAPDQVKAVRRAYRELFLAGETLDAALSRLKDPAAPPPVQLMLQFIEAGLKGRGITRPASGAAAEEAEVAA